MGWAAQLGPWWPHDGVMAITRHALTVTSNRWLPRELSLENLPAAGTQRDSDSLCAVVFKTKGLLNLGKTVLSKMLLLQALQFSAVLGVSVCVRLATQSNP